MAPKGNRRNALNRELQPVDSSSQCGNLRGMDTDFKAWFFNMTQEQREAYAKRAETSASYIQRQLTARRKIPREDLMKRLAAASEGKWTVPALLAFFYRTRETAVDDADRALAGPAPQAAGWSGPDRRRQQMRG